MPPDAAAKIVDVVTGSMARPNTSEGDRESFPQVAPPFVVSYRPCWAVPAKIADVSAGSMARLITPVPGGNPLFLATQCPPPSMLTNVADWFVPAHTVAGPAGSMASATTAPPGRPEPAKDQLPPPSTVLNTYPAPA